MAAPTSVDVIDFATEKEFQRVVGLSGAGIRRAVGAKKRNIMTQFIMEAIVLCEVGGVIGVALGILGGNVAAILLKVPPVVPVDWIIFGLLICSIVGIIFGTYPAFKAANLDPIESLRYE